MVGLARWRAFTGYVVDRLRRRSSWRKRRLHSSLLRTPGAPSSDARPPATFPDAAGWA